MVVKPPPIRGPITLDTPKIAPNIPQYIGSFSSGASGIMITMTPEKTPAEPHPETARPMMNVVDDGAAPQSTEPASKRTTAAWKTNLLL